MSASLEDLERDVSLEINLEEELKTKKEYDSLVTLANKDHQTGRTDSLEVEIKYELKGPVNKNFSITRSLNRFSSSNTGTLFFEKNGTYELCAYAKPLNFKDYNLSNNQECKEINITGPSIKKDPCGCELTITLSEKTIKKGSQTIQLEYCQNDSNTYRHQIKYWLEDIYGETIRNPVTTTSPTPKTYTPSIAEGEKGMIVKAEIPSCELKEKEVFLAYSDKQTEPFLEMEIPLESYQNDWITIDIKGYKADSNKRVVDYWLEKNNRKISKDHKFYINNKNSAFDLRLPFKVPDSEEGIHILRAEGLGLETEERIYLRHKAESEVLNQIENMYTRHSLFRNEVNIFARTDGYRGEVVFFSTEGNQTKKVKNDGFNKTIKINHPKEIIGLKLKDQGVKAFLVLDLKKEDSEKETENTNKENNGEDTNETVLKTPHINNEENINNNKESNNKMLNYTIAGLAGLSLIAIFLKKD